MKGCSLDDGQAAAASLKGVWIQASGLIGSSRWPALGTEEAAPACSAPLLAPKGLDIDFAETSKPLSLNGRQCGTDDSLARRKPEGRALNGAAGTARLKPDG